jgi:hypothetical protein
VPDLDVAAVSHLLVQHWDALGVADNDVEPGREYLHEAAAVVALLRSGSTRAEVTAYLSDAAVTLSSRPDATRDRQAAQAIFQYVEP